MTITGDLDRLERLVRSFDGRRVLVLGDAALDEYVVGRPARISREAPVIILEYASSFVRAGSGANAAVNLASLGANVQIVGTIGEDEMGRRLANELVAQRVDIAGLIVDRARPTATKTRIIAKGVQEVQQQVVRIDRLAHGEVCDEVRQRMIEAACSGFEEADALLISDYTSGVISQEVIDVCLPEARRRGIVTVVDSHGDLFRFTGVTAATPNQPEAALTAGRSIITEDELDRAGDEILRGMDALGVLITRGSEGIALYQREAPPLKLPVATGDETAVVDPNGAGDTVAAVFTLALCAGGSMSDGAVLGNVAGAEVVRRLGAATLSPAELQAAIRRANHRLTGPGS